MNIEKTIKSMERRGFEVHYFETGEEAVSYLAETLVGKTVGIGGSMTVCQLGIYDAIKDNNTVIWHLIDDDPEAPRKATGAPVYISGANAIAETGEILNIDGRGNRVAATLFDKELVYIISGTNKICDSYESAMKRARQVAGPLNAKRLNLKTPCVKDGTCHDCNSPGRICNAAVALWGRPYGVDKIEVILVNDELGF